MNARAITLLFIITAFMWQPNMSCNNTTMKLQTMESKKTLLCRQAIGQVAPFHGQVYIISKHMELALVNGDLPKGDGWCDHWKMNPPLDWKRNPYTMYLLH